MQTDIRHARKRRLRMHPGNLPACLACYLIAFGLPVLWQYAAIHWIYPWKLASTAPDVTAQLLRAMPLLDRWIDPVAAVSADGAFSLRYMLAAREEAWLGYLNISAAAAWLGTLIMQLLWRFTHRKPLFSARQNARAIRSCRLMLAVVWLMNIALAAGVWLSGVQHITGRTLWDYLVSFGVYPLLPLAAALVSRLAASPAISGKHAYFKRL